MTSDVLGRMLDIRGVTSAALVDGVGETVHAVSREGEGSSLVGGLIISSLATSRVLADLLGEGELTQTMIDFETGPVLLAPLAGVAGRADTGPGADVSRPTGTDASRPTGTDAYVAVLTLSAASTLGRVRLGLRKLLPELAKAVKTP